LPRLQLKGGKILHNWARILTCLLNHLHLTNLFFLPWFYVCFSTTLFPSGYVITQEESLIPRFLSYPGVMFCTQAWVGCGLFFNPGAQLVMRNQLSFSIPHPITYIQNVPNSHYFFALLLEVGWAWFFGLWLGSGRARVEAFELGLFWAFKIWNRAWGF
jgi:hypothetical protein